MPTRWRSGEGAFRRLYPERRRGGRFRLAAAVVVLALAAAACADGGDAVEGGGSRTTSPTITVDAIKSSPTDEGPSALDNMKDPSFPTPLVDPDEIVSGGPPPDGIPPIDKPAFERAKAVEWLEDDEPVLALELNGEARAYPVQILTWHEIVNDAVGDVPVVVTYCPLCNSAIAFDRRVDDRVLDFGTSGRLYRSAPVMFDRQTESLWTHYTGQAVVGRLTGERVRAYPVSTVSWADFRKAHGDGLVLSKNTGFDRAYGRNPYPGYDDVNTSPFLFEGEHDGRLAAKTRIVGVEVDGASVAVPLDVLRDRRVMPVQVGRRRLVIWWKPGTASALQSARVADGGDVGATGVFDPTVDGAPLDFEHVGDDFADLATGSTWDIFGRSTAGPMTGSTIQAVPHVDTFWFAWAAYRPDTSIVDR